MFYRHLPLIEDGVNSEIKSFINASAYGIVNSTAGSKKAQANVKAMGLDDSFSCVHSFVIDDNIKKYQSRYIGVPFWLDAVRLVLFL